MKKNIIITVIGFVILWIFIGFYMYNKPHRNIAKAKADYVLTANKLFDDFDTNEKESNKKYLDKVIQVSGKIIDIDKDQNGQEVLTLEAENAMIGGVSCTIKDKNAEFTKGDNVELKCKCTGFLSDVVLIECSKVR